jgi:hypothetical protein
MWAEAMRASIAMAPRNMAFNIGPHAGGSHAGVDLHDPVKQGCEGKTKWACLVQGE